MGAAPRSKASRKGLDKQYVWLGTGTPGDTLGNFGSAIDQLAQRSTYFYEEQGHYWFDTQPSVTKTASDYAERLREDVETVWNEIVQRLRGEERARGVFDRVHVAPESSADIPDLENTRLVIVHPRHSRRKQDGSDSAAHQWVRDAIESKGASQRVHRNTLVFLMADKSELESLEAATRSYLGWKRVQATSDSLNLSTQQRKQTDEWVTRLNQTVSDRIRETFAWALYPEQFDPTKPFEIVSEKVPDSAGRSLAERVGAKLGRDDQLVTELGAPILGATLHEELGTLWSSAREMSVGELWGYFTRYVYLPRLTNREVLESALERALNAVLVDRERFAIASGKDPETGRYRGLIVPPDHNAALQITDSTILVDWSLAEQQAQVERAEAIRRAAVDAAGDGTEPIGPVDYVTPSPGVDFAPEVPTPAPDTARSPIRYFGSVKVDPTRYSRDIGNVTREVIDRLVGAGAKLEITIDIQAIKSDGFDEGEMRTISENTRVLKFDASSGFEN
ncbi:DUF499 domain-containing protein [Microbacterium sp. IO18]|uniref:DUF499 domain-containing protein n=1 Tax=Microbacterium sp. IO18 TaxID=3390997 RepID=UPI003B9FEB34